MALLLLINLVIGNVVRAGSEAALFAVREGGGYEYEWRVHNFVNEASLVPGPSSISIRAIKMEDLRGMVGH